MSIEDRVREILRRPAPAEWRPTGRDRTFYLDLMERIVRTAVNWQDENGAIIDPVEHSEHGQTSCRFVAPAAILLSAGRCEDLREHVLRGMDWCCMRLASGQAQSPDFWMREVMTAWKLLDAEPTRRARWERDIRSVDPEKTYTVVSPDGSRLTELNNWTVYAAAGEAMREVAGLGPVGDEAQVIWGKRFFEKYMPAQLTHFSDLGMYRDPGDPFTYDMTTRLQIATALNAGISTSLAGELNELLRRGALAQLLYVSPDGFAPFGGRSNQMNLQEAILAALCELEAARYRESDPRLAGAFKRQGHLHAIAISRWIVDSSPIRHLKNGFDPSTRHGCEQYAKWSVYSLFAASCLGLAWMFADDHIQETPAPAEIGGYLLELRPAFHKIFAACGGSQIEIDTAADLHYDATGLGRFCHAGLPPELGLAMPFAAHPSYHLPKELLPETDSAIGPEWRTPDGRWANLAALSQDLRVDCEVEEESPGQVAFVVRWSDLHGAQKVTQSYCLTPGRLQIRAQVSADAIRFIVPLLVTDGSSPGVITLTQSDAKVRYRSGEYEVRFDSQLQSRIGRPMANRNGIYRPLILEKAGNSIELSLELRSSAAG